MKQVKFLALTLLGWLCSLGLWAYDFKVDGFYYSVTSFENSEVEVTHGDWTNVSVADEGYKGEIIIPETVSYKDRNFKVTGIGYRAFWGCSNLTSIDFKKVQTIGNEAFEGCTGLTSIDFGNFVHYIGAKAFYKCTGLTTVDFGQVQTIGNNCFEHCYGLTTLDFKNVKKINLQAFGNCTHLKTIDFGNVQFIESYAFYKCTGLTTINFKNVEKIEPRAFAKCTGLTTIDFGQVQTIGSDCFDQCSGLTDVVFGQVKTIGTNAFGDCTSLTSIDLKNVQTIEDGAFGDCTSLASIDLKNVQKIGDFVFSGCTGVTSIKTSQQEPPVLGSHALENLVYMNAKLEVPAGCKGAFQQAEGWKDFFTIVESGEAGKISLFVSCSEGGQVDFNTYSVTDHTISAPFKIGEKVRMTFTPHQGYALQSVVVDERDVTADVTDHRYTVIMDSPKNVVVTFMKVPVYLTIQQADNGQTSFVVEDGKSYLFKLDAAEGWKINTVTFNGVDVTADLDADHTYRTPAITEDSKLIVSFELVVPSAITDLSVHDISVKGFDNQLVIEGANEGEPISVYTAAGALLAAEISNGLSHQITVEPGQVYIVKVSECTFKIAL